ncbi:MAG: glucose-6-phosphate isomerase [Endomicrobiaceae bacterium]|nr:glucose-6-phosphate isomerase [Endomicrobiaceae bacterium]
MSSVGKGAVLNSDVLKAVINDNKQVALGILNEMMSNISPAIEILDINRQDNGFAIKIKENGKEQIIELSDNQIIESKLKTETTFTKDNVAMFEAFDSLQEAFRQIREENRGGQKTTVNLDKIKSLVNEVENSAIKKQLQEATDRLEKSSKTAPVKKELENLAQYRSTRLTEAKINETISALEQGKLKLRNEKFDIIERDSNGKEIVIGVVDRNIAHHLELYHRVSCMFVVTPEGNIIEIRRARHKSEPGQITPYGGHVSSGETYETTRERELVEELGLPKDWKLQGRFEHLVTDDKYPQEAFNQKHDELLDNDSMNISAYFLSADELEIVKGEMKKLEQLRAKMTPQQYDKYLEENSIENYDIQEFNPDSFMAIVNASGKNETSYAFSDGSKVDFIDTFPDFFKRILFPNQQDIKKFREIIAPKVSVEEKNPELSDIWKSIEQLAAKDYPELVAQTKIDIARMIETDAFLSNDEKKLSAEEKKKLVEAKIATVLQQLKKYLSGDLSRLIPSSKEKTVGFGTAGNRGIIGEEFDFNNVALIAQAIANIINRAPNLPKEVFVGNDTRFLGKWFSVVIERVLTANGIQVYTTKEKISTPTIACYVKEVMPGKFAATLNVTASHNPKEYNGVKPNSGDGAPALPSFTKMIADEIKEIQDLQNGKILKIAKKENSIIVTDADIKHFEYVKERLNNLIGLKEGETLESFRQKASRIGIVLEAKNTALIPVLKSLFNYYGFTNVIVLNETRDVAFGGKVNPEPNDKNTLELESMVKRGKALFKEQGMDIDFSFGISTDPDGDRFCVKDVNGTHMTPDEIGTIDAYELLENLISEMKAKRDAGQLTLAEIKKYQSIIVKSMVTTFALDSLAEVYSKEFMDIAFGEANKSVTEKDKVKYISDYVQGTYTPISVITTPVGWKNIADGQKEVEKSGNRFLIGVESSGGISIGLYDKDGAPATMMPVLFAAKSGETLEQKLEKVEKKIGLKVHSIETAVKFPVVIETEIEKNTKDILEVTVSENEVDDDDKISIKATISEIDIRKLAVLKFAKKELNKKDEWYQTATIADIVKELAGSRQKALLDWIEETNPGEIEQLLYKLGMSKDLKVVNIIKLPKEGIQIQMADSNYKEGDSIKTLLTFRASGTEPLVRVYSYTIDKKLTESLKDIGESIVKGAFKTDVPVLTDTPEYKAIQTEVKKDKSLIKDLFTEDFQKPQGEKRGDKFQRKINLGKGSSLFFDFSRSAMTEKLLSLFINLFNKREVKEKIEAMFRGDKINWTENRAVLHTALRNTSDQPVYVDGVDVMPKVKAVLQKMKDFSDKIIKGEWKGATGKKITDIVSIGIGGSDLGPRMATEALSQFKADGAPNVHFISNVDPNDIDSILNGLGLNPETTLFIIESKTFTTEETMANAELAKQWSTLKASVESAKQWSSSQKSNYSDIIKKHFVAVSTNKDKVAEFGIDTENMFEFWDWVGGRYSVWSAVGLPLMCSVGYDNFVEFLDGAHEMDVNFRTAPYDRNIPMIMAMLNMLNSNFLGRIAYAILPYNRYLKSFTAHIQQVYMESLGKTVDRQGRRVKSKTGSIVYGTAGTDAQHSYLQEHHQGSTIIPVDFIGFITTRLTDPNMQTSHKRLLANLIAQSDAMAFGRTYEQTVEKLVSEGVEIKEAERKAKDQIFDGNRPSNILLFNELNPRTLGAMIALYEDMVATLGAIWDINAFDQMGVELGKVNAKSTFNALQKGISEGFNSSTANLIDLISGKLEISGVWDSVKNSRWVKILSRVINPKATFEGQMRVRNLAVAIKEFPRTLNLEKFIQSHTRPENIRQQATELMQVTKQSFVKSLSIAWTGALFGALGIALTAVTGGLFLVGTIAITSVLFLTPFITASVTNIKWHYEYNNSQDRVKTELVAERLLNNREAENYVRGRLLENQITGSMSEGEKILYSGYVKNANKTELALMLINNKYLLDDITELLSKDVYSIVGDIERTEEQIERLEYRRDLNTFKKIFEGNEAGLKTLETIKAWLMINAGLKEETINYLFNNGKSGLTYILKLANGFGRSDLKKAAELVNASQYEIDSAEYYIPQLVSYFQIDRGVVANVVAASYNFDAKNDSILKALRYNNKLETGKEQYNIENIKDEIHNLPLPYSIKEVYFNILNKLSALEKEPGELLSLFEGYKGNELRDLLEGFVRAQAQGMNLADYCIGLMNKSASKTNDIKTLKDLNVKGKTVLVRVDYNVPLDGNLNITNNKRIRETVDTINYLRKQGAKVVLMSHLGRPDGKVVESMSLKPVAKELSRLLGVEVKFAPDSIGTETKKMANELNSGEVLLLENLRFYPQEEGKNEKGEKDKDAMNAFAKELASMGDVFVQDAFGVVHRAHASTAAIVKYIKETGAGYLLEKEINFLGRQLDERGKDKRKGDKKGEGFVAVLGGSKVSDKINIIENLLNKADVLIIGGAMAYTFLKAQGIETGQSRVEEDKVDLARQLLQKAKDKGVKILLPIDHITTSQGNVDFKNQVVLNLEDIHETTSNSIDSGAMGVDVGPKTNEMFAEVIKNADAILWNGPLGVFEIEQFSKGTIGMAEAIAQATDKGAMSVVGGGDSVSAVEKAGVEKRMSHISTGGGASLEFLEGKVLPGIDALKNKDSMISNKSDAVSTEKKALEKAVKKIYSLSENDRKKTLDSFAKKYPKFDFRLVGNMKKEETIALRIGVFFAVHSDGQLYKNANEPDTIPVSSTDKIPQEISQILAELTLYGQANSFYDEQEKIFAVIARLGLFQGRLDDGYAEILKLGSRYNEYIAKIKEGLEKYNDVLTDDQKKELKYYMGLKDLIEKSIEVQRYNMGYIYGGELASDFERWIREQVGLQAIYDAVETKGVWDEVEFAIIKVGTDEKNWKVTFKEGFEDILRIQALNVSANLARRDGYEKLEKGTNGVPKERLGRVLEGILQNELGPTYTGQVYNTDAYVDFKNTMIKRRAFMQYLAFRAVIVAIGNATDTEIKDILANSVLTEQERTELSRVIRDIRNYYNQAIKDKQMFTEGNLGNERLQEVSNLLTVLDKATKLGFNVLGNQNSKIRQSAVTVFSAAPGAGKGTLADYIFSNDKGVEKGDPNLYKGLYDKIQSQLFHTRRIRTHLNEQTAKTYNFVPPENLGALSQDGSIVDKDGNPVSIKVVKINGQLQGAVIGLGALIPIRHFIKNNPTEDTPWDYYLTENEKVQVEQWKQANPGKDIKEMTLTRGATGMGVLFSSDLLTYMEGGLSWKLALEKAYPNISTIFINSYDSATKKLRAASDKILHNYVTDFEELRKANEILRKMRIETNSEIDLTNITQLNELLRLLNKDEAKTTPLISSALSPITILMQSFIKNLQLASLALLYKDKTSYTIVADVNDNARIKTANILAKKGIKVNLILVGETGIVKETKERLEQNGKLAYGLVDKKDNLTIYAAEKIDNMTDTETIESIIKNIKSTDKSEIMILDITSDVYDDLSGKDLINDMIVKPNASPNELFIEALKQKHGKYKEQVLQFASLAENVSAEQLEGYNDVNIQNVKEKGLTTINITVDADMLAEKSAKLLEIIKSAHNNGLKVVFNYKVDLKDMNFDNFADDITKMMETFRNFTTDGINLDFSDSGELAVTSYLLVALTKLQEEIKNLAVKMPSSINENAYKGIFNRNGIKTIVNYKDIKNITDRQNVIVDVNIEKDVNNIFDQKELMSIFVNNNISMVAFDSQIIEAFAKSNEGFSFMGIKNVAELLNAIFNTTPEGQYLKGIAKGRSIATDQADIKGLYELLKDGGNIAEKIKKYLPESEKTKEYTQQQAKGILQGILEQIEWNAVDGNKLVFKNKEHQDMFMDILVKYRLLTGNSYQNNGKYLEEILNPLNNNEKIKEVLKLINSTDSAYNTEFVSINILSSMIEDDISQEAKQTVLEGLLTLLLGMSTEIKNIDVMETMSVKDISAILKAA